MAAPNKEKKSVLRRTHGNHIMYICPKCGNLITQKKKLHRNLCMKCGQYLDWTDSEDLYCVFLICQNMEQAYYSAMKYKEIVGTSYALDLDEWRLKSDRWWPKELYFPFMEKNAYGRFMRWVAKDGPTRVIK